MKLEKKNEVEKVNLKEPNDIYRGEGIKFFGRENLITALIHNLTHA